MNDFEVLSVLVACLALIVSLSVWAGQRKLQREANDLQKVTAELSKRQLELIDQQEAARNQSELLFNLAEEGRSHKLLLKNLGPADAFDIEIESLGTKQEDVLLVREEIDERFPMRRLRSGETAKLNAAIYVGSSMVFRLRARWKTANGTQRQEDYTVGF
jgi:hypothetical protein